MRYVVFSLVYIPRRQALLKKSIPKSVITGDDTSDIKIPPFTVQVKGGINWSKTFNQT